MRQSANTLPLGQVGKRTTIYWQRRDGEGRTTGVLTEVRRYVEATALNGLGFVVRHLTETTATIDGVEVPCDEWEAAE